MRTAKKDCYGDFGNMASLYKIARQDFASTVFDYLWEQINKVKRQIEVICDLAVKTPLV